MRLLTRKATDITDRLPVIAAAMAQIPADTLVLDGELVALDPAGLPTFATLQPGRRRRDLVTYVFDVMHHDGTDLRLLSLIERRAVLEHVVAEAHPAIRLSVAFDDGTALMLEATRLSLEGVVSKRRAGLYRSGSRSGWVKCKTAAWAKANRGRWEQMRER